MMIRYLLLPLVLSGFLYGQFEEVTVTMDLERLSMAERQNVTGMDQAIEQFFTGTPWEDDIADLGMTLDITIAFQGVMTLANEKYFQAQVLFTNRQDNLFFIRDARFPYRSGESLMLSPMFSEMSSLCEFYAYLFIAHELDTYDLLGGSSYYSMASTLASTGRSQSQVKGAWNSRAELVDRLSNNQELRRAKAYFYMAYDVLGEENYSPAVLRETLGNFYNNIRKIIAQKGQERYTTLFLNGHAAEIADLLATAEMWTELADMPNLNPENERIYRKFQRR